MSAQRVTPLFDRHVEAGARMTDFAGFAMPLFYTSILAEHMQVRRRAGLFDVSHMGRFVLTGPGALSTLEQLVPTNVSSLQPGRAVYTLFLNDVGGIRDDLIVYRRRSDYLLVVNAGNRSRDWEWLESHLASAAEAVDRSDETGLMALQGPLAFHVLEELGARLSETQPPGQDRPDSIPHFACAEGTLADRPVLFMRTGYTGEDGVEIMCAREDTVALWGELLAVGRPSDQVAPCGLGARDTLRLEAALPLWGQDIDETTTPFEAGLGRVVHLQKSKFIGREALLVQAKGPPRRRLVGLMGEGRNLLRPGDSILRDETDVGRVTSGTYSPVLQRPIALGYVATEFAEVGSWVSISARNRHLPAQIVERPFYKRGVTPLPTEPLRQD